MAYEERRDPADRRLGLHDCNVLARSPTAYRWCGEALREGLLWDGNERERWLARLDAILPRMLEAGGEVFHLYLGLTLARLKGEHESRGRPRPGPAAPRKIPACTTPCSREELAPLNSSWA